MIQFPADTSPSVLNRRRQGATLTEVLMSLMIMGIGVVSLATLFPLSTQRVLEASNLTNSTVVRFNAEGLVDAFPALVHEPDGDATTREAGRNYVVDPLGWYEHISQGVTTPTRFEYNRPTLITEPPTAQQTRYLGEKPGSASVFTGMDISRTIVGLPDSATEVVKDVMPDPDGTNMAAYKLNAENRIAGVTLPATVDLTVVQQEPALYRITIQDKSGRYSETRQITSCTGQDIAWDLDGDASADYPGEDLPLPARFTQDTNSVPNMGKVRVELPRADYSWLLTVRKRSSGPANVDVVVFRKRDFSQLSEQYYMGDLRRYSLGADGAPGVVGVDENLNGTNDDVREIGYRGSDDEPNNRVVVDWTPAGSNGAYGTSTYPATVEKPPLRRGGYLFDLTNGLWYRIQSFEGYVDSTGQLLDTASTVILETAIARDNTEDLSGNGALGDFSGEDDNSNNALNRGGVVIPKGVVAVFPLETK